MKFRIVLFLLLIAFIAGAFYLLQTNKVDTGLVLQTESKVNLLEEGHLEVKCYDNKTSCIITNAVIPEGFSMTWGQIFYDEDDTYTSFIKESDRQKLTNAEFCFFTEKNDPLFCERMDAGTDGPIINVLKTENGLTIRYLTRNESGEIELAEKELIN